MKGSVPQAIRPTGIGKGLLFTHRLGTALLARLRTVALDSRGGLLLDTVVATIVFALIGTTVLVGVSTARRTGTIVDNQSIAENLARNQLAYVFDQAYKPPSLSYASIADLPNNDFGVPSDFGVTTAAVLRTGSNDPDIETVRVTISHSGEDILVLETIRGRD